MAENEFQIIPVLPFALPDRIHVAYEDGNSQLSYIRAHLLIFLTVQLCIAVLLAMYGGALLVGSCKFLEIAQLKSLVF